MKKNIIFIILTVGLQILSCKPAQEILHESVQGIIDEHREEYRIINTWFPRNTTFYQMTLTNDFEGGPLDGLITDQNIKNTDYYVTAKGKLGLGRTLAPNKIAEFKQKAIDLKEVELRQDLIAGLVVNEKVGYTSQIRITFPIISNDGFHAIVYRAGPNFGSMLVFKKTKGGWGIFSQHTVFETPQYE